MAEPQGIASFTGISADDFRGATFTRSCGVVPDACIFYLTPQASMAASIGTLSFSYDGNTRSWTNCAIDTAYMQEVPLVENSRQVVVILDRRWRWKQAVIEIDVNERGADGELIAAKKVEPSVIANACLVAMGETGHSVAGMATGMYPRFKYSGRADKLLQELCHITAHKVVPAGDEYNVVQYGSGADLPASGKVVLDYSIDESATPNQIAFVAGPSTFQSKLKLEAVGHETDGSIEVISSLSYKPAVGWEKTWHSNFYDVAVADRARAFNDIWRLYKIKEQFAGGLTIPGASEVPTNISQYLPLNAKVNGDEPAYAEGVFWPESLLGTNTPAATRYPLDPEIEPATGLVRFANPVIQFTSNKPAEPTLGLVCQYHLKKANGAYDAFYKTTSLTGGQGTENLYHPEVSFVNKTFPTSSSNTTSLNAEADVYLARHAAKYADKAVKQMQYEGYPVIDPTGLVAQSKLTAGLGQLPITEASRIKEFDIYNPSEGDRERRVWVEGSR